MNLTIGSLFANQRLPVKVRIVRRERGILMLRYWNAGQKGAIGRYEGENMSCDFFLVASLSKILAVFMTSRPRLLLREEQERRSCHEALRVDTGATSMATCDFS